MSILFNSASKVKTISKDRYILGLAHFFVVVVFVEFKSIVLKGNIYLFFFFYLSVLFCVL